MEKVFRKIKFSSGSTYNLNIVLQEKFTLLGTFDSDETSINSPEYSTNGGNIVTGETMSRLSDVETYDPRFPFKIGVNGVIDVQYNLDDTINYVIYEIDGITYKTFVSTEFTTYSYIARGIDSLTGVNFSLIKNDKLLGINGKPEVLSFVNVERQEISVFDTFYRLKNINNIGDLVTYGGGKFFNVVSAS